MIDADIVFLLSRAGVVRQFAQPSQFGWFAAIHLALGYFTLSG